MSVRAEKIGTVNKAARPTIIVDFDAERLKAPFLLRCGALLIDYILLIAVPVIFLLIGRLLGNDGRKLLDSQLSSTGWLIAVLIAVSNLVIFPLLGGQSIGKMVTGLRIVKNDGAPVSMSRILIRHLLGYPLTILTLGIGFLISVVNARGRALHDFLAGTIVVYGHSRTREMQNSKFKKQNADINIEFSRNAETGTK